MAHEDFNPKLGRIQSKSNPSHQRYLNRVIKSMRQTSQRGVSSSGGVHFGRGAGHAAFTGSRTGRGYSKSAALSVRSFQPGRRRVVIKARFTKFKNGSLGAARAHLKYIQRDGVTREGKAGNLYGPDTDHADGKSFLSEAEGDRHQFRFIVAPEDGAQLNDLKPFIRDLMTQAETDLGTKLDWVAVDHFNTGYPHTHIIVRGKDDQGNDLVIARDYLSHGLRERARDLITLELGPETQHELDQKIKAEIKAERFTRLDRAIINDADMGILTISASPHQDQQYLTHRIGRLRKLETMGLAEELKPHVWKIADRTEATLKHLGERGDVIKTMQRVLKEAGVDRSISDYSVFDAYQHNNKITGKIIHIGLSNELTDQHYVLVDGAGGKLHYAEIGQLNPNDPPRKDMIVTLRARQTDNREYPAHSENQTQWRVKPKARMFIESPISIDRLSHAEGATWLDRMLLSRQPDTYRNKGFGSEINQALRQRQQWLIKQGLMTEQNNGKLIAQKRLLAKLTEREVINAGNDLARKNRLSHVNSLELGKTNVKITQSIRLISGRFAMMQKGKHFALVPWKQAMKIKKNKGMGIGMQSVRRISR